jgi:alpha-tubulin suppressor-like RCC1 family protein
MTYINDTLKIYQFNSVYFTKISNSGIDSISYLNDVYTIYTKDSAYSSKISNTTITNGINNYNVYYVLDSNQVGGGVSTAKVGDRVTRLKSDISKYGGYGNVFLMGDNTIKACGTGTAGGYGTPDEKRVTIPMRVTVGDEYSRRGNFIEVFGDYQGLYALTDSGEVYAKGENEAGQLGDGTYDNNGLLRKIDFFEQNNIKVKKLICGGRSSSGIRSSLFAITNQGKVYSWGFNNYGQLGVGDNNYRNIPTLVTGLQNKNITNLFIGDSWHNCIAAIDDSNNLYTWGQGDKGTLGLGTLVHHNTPQQVPGIKASEVAISHHYDNYMLIITPDSMLMGAGQNNLGQLGDGTNVNPRTSFVSPVGGFDNVAEIDVSSDEGTSLFINYDRELYMTGSNAHGQMGDGTTQHRTTFQKVNAPFQKMVKKAKMGGIDDRIYTVVLDTNGQLWGCGYNTSGQLGRGHSSNNTSTRSFEKYKGLPRGAKILDFALYGVGDSGGVTVLLEDGRAFSTGWNVDYGAGGTGALNPFDGSVFSGGGLQNNSVFYEVKF